MARLTEEMIAARSRTLAADLGSIKKLNCWGGELQDISLLRRMANVEVLSLSVNKISTLSDVQYCHELRELYIRKNDLKNLNELCYLQGLQRLTGLWLLENPCSVSDPLYRYTVIKNLPNLEILDDIKITPEEKQDALKKGRELVHPEDCQNSTSSSPSLSPTRHQSRSPERGRRGSGQIQESNGSRKSYSPEADHHNNTNDIRYTQYVQLTDRYHNINARRSEQGSSYNLRSALVRLKGHMLVRLTKETCITLNPDNSIISTSNDKPMENGVTSNGVCDKCYNPMPSGGTKPSSEVNEMEKTNQQGSNLMRTNNLHASPTEEPEEIPIDNKDYSNHQYERSGHHAQSNRRDYRGESRRGSSSEGSGRLSPQRVPVEEDSIQHYERSNRECQQQIDATSQRLDSDRRHTNFPQRRSGARNTNILSAVLCLIKELDYSSLEVVSIAVRCRMDELED